MLRQPNGGLCSARNLGVSASTATWLTFLDSDDLWPADYLERVERNLQGADAGVVAHVGDIRFTGKGYDRTLWQIKGVDIPPGEVRRMERPLPFVISGMSMIAAAVRRSAFDAVGGFDLRQKLYEDTALFTRLALTGDLLVAGDVLAEARRVEGDGAAMTQMEQRAPARARAMKVLYLTTLAEQELTPDQRRLVNDRLSGAQFLQAEALLDSDPPAARRLLLDAARIHPKPLVGWLKSAAVMALGRRGYGWTHRRAGGLDRG